MENVFLHLLNMSLTAAVLVVVVLLLRLVFHRAPRWIHCLLWALVAVRLLCPFTIESDLSLMPSTPVVTVPDSLTLSDPVIIPNTPAVDVIVPDTPTTSVPPQTDVGGTVTTPITPTLPDSSVAAPGDSVDPWQVALAVATQVWLLGALALLAYAVISTIRLRLQVRESVRMQGNIWQCDHLRSPFILGVLRPRIYLPSDLDATAQASVIAHEKAHLRRLDHLWKPLGFLLLAVYWFNPLLWVAYIFLCRDIEAACDEQVVRNMTAADRKAYSEALLACSAPRRLIAACPLAFGETSVKSRIKSVLSYKKPTIWIIVAALLVSTVAGVCLLTDRPVAKQEPDDPPSVSDEDDTPDTAKTAPVGLTHVAGGMGQWYDETLQAVYGTPPEGSLPIKAFASYDELDAFLSAYATEEGKIQRADFAAFDAAWFADNALLMSYYTHPSTPAYPKVDSYVYSEDGAGLTVRLHVYVPSFGNDAFCAYHLFSGIRKSDLEGVKALTAVVAATIPNDYYVAAFAEHTEHPDKAAEKWRQWLPSDEGWALDRMLSEWEETDRWVDAQSVDLTFTTAFNLHGHTHYFAPHYSALLRDDGALLWLNEAEGAFLRWIAAYYDESNETLLYMAFSHPTSYYDRRYAAAPVVLNSPELKTIVNSNRWETAHGTVTAYGRFIVGGTVYRIDRSRERIVYADYNSSKLYAVYLTAEELAAVDAILASTTWAHTDYMVGKVTQVSIEEDYVTIKLTDSSKYTGDISDGDLVRVSLRYYAGEMPAVGSTIRVTYDGYLDTYYDGERYGPLIHALSITVTSQPGGTTTTTTTTAKPTTTTTTTPTTPAITKTAAVVFNCTRQNMLYDREVEKLFGASSVVSIDSVDALKALMKSYSDFNLPLYPEYDHNAAFFEEYALLITYYETASGSVRPRAAEYTYSADGTVLTVVVDELWPNNGLVTDDIGEWLMLSVIQKSDLKGVAKLNSTFRARLPENSISFLVNPASDPRHSAEKQSKTITDMEAHTLYRILIGSMSDEEWGGWTFPSDVQFDVKLVLDGDTFYYDIDSGMVIATEGKTVHYMVWTMCFDKLAKRTNMIDWVLARYSDTNDAVWLWEDFETDYYTNDARLVNTPEMHSIALRTNWTENSSRNRTYDAQYTIGGALYYVDLEHEAVLTADEKQVSSLTKEEVAYLRSVLDADT